MIRDEIAYALRKQVPDMARGFVIATTYGDLRIDGDLAQVVAAVVRQSLNASAALAEADACLQEIGAMTGRMMTAIDSEGIFDRLTNTQRDRDHG